MVYNTQNNQITGLRPSLTVGTLILHSVLYIGIHGLGSLGRFVAQIFAYITPRLCMPHHSYCIFSRYLPSTQPGLRHSCNCSYYDMGCQMSKVSSFQGTQQSRWLSLHMRTETDAVSEMLRFLIFRIPDNGQSPVHHYR
jgi:hypothetical protein